MTDNAVLRLRAERLARATRPFLARGNRIHRCQRCLLPLKQCLCATLKPAAAASRFCLVSEWNHPYTRELAVFPAGLNNKYWPTVKRLDDVYGDRNLFCSCVPMSEYQ